MYDLKSQLKRSESTVLPQFTLHGVIKQAVAWLRH